MSLKCKKVFKETANHKFFQQLDLPKFINKNKRKINIEEPSGRLVRPSPNCPCSPKKNAEILSSSLLSTPDQITSLSSTVQCQPLDGKIAITVEYMVKLLEFDCLHNNKTEVGKRLAKNKLNNAGELTGIFECLLNWSQNHPASDVSRLFQPYDLHMKDSGWKECLSYQKSYFAQYNMIRSKIAQKNCNAARDLNNFACRLQKWTNVSRCDLQFPKLCQAVAFFLVILHEAKLSDSITMEFCIFQSNQFIESNFGLKKPQDFILSFDMDHKNMNISSSVYKFGLNQSILTPIRELIQSRNDGMDSESKLDHWFDWIEHLKNRRAETNSEIAQNTKAIQQNLSGLSELVRKRHELNTNREAITETCKIFVEISQEMLNRDMNGDQPNEEPDNQNNKDTVNTEQVASNQNGQPCEDRNLDVDEEHCDNSGTVTFYQGADESDETNQQNPDILNSAIIQAELPNFGITSDNGSTVFLELIGDETQAKNMPTI